MLKKNHNYKIPNHKQARGIWKSGFRVLLFFVIFCYSAESYGTEFSVQPSVTLKEEYDNNIFLTKDNKVDDYITRVMPSMKMDYKAMLWEWSLDYTFKWWYYSKRGKEDNSQNLNLISKTKVISNFLYFDVSDTYASVVFEPRRPSTEDNLGINRTDSNNFIASPYIKYRLTDSTSLSVGYRYTNIWYKKEGSIDRQMHTGFTSIEHIFSPRLSASISGDYTQDRPDMAVSENNQQSASLKLIYAIDPKTKFNGSIGYKWIDFSHRGNEDRPIYNAGLMRSLYGNGYIELTTDSAFTTSPLHGIYERKKNELAAKYGQIISVSWSIFQRKDKYVEVNRKDYATGGTLGFEVKPYDRFVFKITGKYEKNKFMPEGEKREIYGLSEEIGYKFTNKTSMSLSHGYNMENARTNLNDYTNHVIAMQIKTEL
ncbi:MAG: TIGR03016 family PEP-CTERM system-associated outer membrane protein [Nitrospirae bacterium]|nr:TIGR03016 family PEP-CTERM system-associated outer membrane protein [Nitrospirota bacterium]